MRANEFVTALAQSAVGDGCYGFSLNLDRDVLNSAATIEARIANTGQLVGLPIALAVPDRAKIPPPEEGIEWHGSLQFSGWSTALTEPGARLRVIVDNVDVLDIVASGWKAFGRSLENASAIPSFNFHLPEGFADGKLRSLRIEDKSGRQLAGCPVQFVAYGDQLEDAIGGLTASEKDLFRARTIRLHFPQSWPLSRYDDWLSRVRARQQPDLRPAREIAVIVAGNDGIEETLTSLERSEGKWIVASLPTDPDDDRFDVAALREFLSGEAGHCATVIFCRAGIAFAPDAPDRIDDLFDRVPDARVAYGDLSVRSADGPCWPIAFPAFDYERLLEQGYLCHLFGSPRETVLARLPEDGAADLFQVVFSLISGPEAGSTIFHLPGECGILPPGEALGSSLALAEAVERHLAARGIPAAVRPREIAMFPTVRVRRAVSGWSTEILIPTRNRTELLQDCIDSIEAGAAKARARITVIDNDSDHPDAKAYLDALKARNIRVLRVPGEFNFSKLNNTAVAYSDADVVCLLNNDVKALDDDWLEEMLSRLAEPDVGAVGALLCTPRGVVQHAGVVLSPVLAADHAFTDRLYGDPGYTDLLKVAHQCSAVTAACLVTRRDDYLTVDGLDEIRFPIDFNDVDYCLKLRSRGKRVVMSPHARLIHLESASRGNMTMTSKILRRAISALRGKWLGALASDPFYSPILALDGVPYSALAWPPRDLSPRTSDGLAPASIPPGM
ncbi:MAG: glycosyltransferase [Xanthobacteraceae bacterium]|nr:glycosyltransferase [Xanthobacteraceae bacterium]